MRAVLVGPPGAGKGTQAQILASELSIPKVSTGDIFRANVSGGTELGKKAKEYMDRGDLVPDEVTNAMVKDRLAQGDAAKGFLLDGFPRNVAQAETLKGMLDELDTGLDVVLELRVDEEEVVKRLSGRRSCPECGRVYHVDYDAPKTEGVCDEDGTRLYQREDDREETVRHRLDVYREQTAPLVEFYEREGLLATISATGPVAEVTARAEAAIAGKRSGS
ncbi:adenylate kinase [Nocardiopsis algeriensis]|uniref:Adenylate kinase n=1 Tax=Nocardiopsis algeriensis TaxID=1478215 RepID=A0A841IUV1_9ACTN|nr:adenylate kinase [Nocardiopsis algeriensis]MBB6121026.1 adenylate kinase [Nocardiopsis algeriensis]